MADQTPQAQAQAWVDRHIGIWRELFRDADPGEVQLIRARCYYVHCDWRIGIEALAVAEAQALAHAAVHIAQGQPRADWIPDPTAESERPF